MYYGQVYHFVLISKICANYYKHCLREFNKLISKQCAYFRVQQSFRKRVHYEFSIYVRRKEIILWLKI